MAIDKLGNSAAGPNNIQAACIKFGKPILLNVLRKVIRKVCRTEKIPEVREEGIICLQYTKRRPIRMSKLQNHHVTKYCTWDLLRHTV